MDLDKENSNEAYISAGYALNQLEQYSDALRYFNESEQLENKSVLYSINTGLSYWGLGDYTKAKEAFEKANLDMHEKPNRRKFYIHQKSTTLYDAEKAWVMLILGNTDGALRMVKNPSWKKNVTLNDLYNLRDWNFVVNHIVKEPMPGLDEFSQYLGKLLIEFGDEKIFNFDNKV